MTIEKIKEIIKSSRDTAAQGAQKADLYLAQFATQIETVKTTKTKLMGHVEALTAALNAIEEAEKTEALPETSEASTSPNE